MLTGMKASPPVHVIKTGYFYSRIMRQFQAALTELIVWHSQILMI